MCIHNHKCVFKLEFWKYTIHWKICAWTKYLYLCRREQRREYEIWRTDVKQETFLSLKIPKTVNIWAHITIENLMTYVSISISISDHISWIKVFKESKKIKKKSKNLNSDLTLVYTLTHIWSIPCNSIPTRKSVFFPKITLMWIYCKITDHYLMSCSS